MSSLALLLTLGLALSPHGGSASPMTNALCPVTGRDVQNHKLHHYVTIRNHAYYVYDREAAVRLRQSPESFLTKEGQPAESRPAQAE